MTQVSLPFDACSLDRPLAPEDGSTDPGDAERSSAPLDLLSTGGLRDVLFIRHPRARRYILRVGSDGVVRVTVPRRGSTREARAFVDRERSWIAEQAARLECQQAERPEDRRRPPSPDIRALRKQARRELLPRLYELAGTHDLSISRVSIRNQRWRWGSCSSRGHICLNWRLIQMPAWVRDYVMVHELMHLRQLDHSPAFWNLVALAYPRYREARHWLRELAERVERRGSD